MNGTQIARNGGSGRMHREVVALVAAFALVMAPAALAQRSQVKPGWNVFSPQDDVKIGQQVSADAERQLPMLNDARVDAYIDRLGKRLAQRAPGEKFPYRFRVVNDRGINAFALPGGFIYIHRGVIEMADSEAQLAGVIGHEISHVALRHGTNQATKAYFAQGLLGILGGVTGSSVGAAIAQLGAGFAASSVLLKYSRTAESQADVVGTQILYDSSYDPRAMAQFFEKLQAQSKGGRPIEFFSSHPNPENREARVNEEVQKLGGAPRGYRSDSNEFQSIKRYVLSLPAPPKAGQRGSSGSSGSGASQSGRPDTPSNRYQPFENSYIRLQHPDNWKVYAQGTNVSFVPDRGAVDDGRGNAALAYGVIMNVFEPHSDRYGQITLESATDELVQTLQQSNPKMRIFRRHERVRVGNMNGLSTYLTNESPLGGREYDWLVTVMRPEGVVYLVFVAPEREYDSYERAFQGVLDSVRFRR